MWIDVSIIPQPYGMPPYMTSPQPYDMPPYMTGTYITPQPYGMPPYMTGPQPYGMPPYMTGPQPYGMPPYMTGTYTFIIHINYKSKGWTSNAITRVHQNKLCATKLKVVCVKFI